MPGPLSPHIANLWWCHIYIEGASATFCFPGAQHFNPHSLMCHCLYKFSWLPYRSRFPLCFDPFSIQCPVFSGYATQLFPGFITQRNSTLLQNFLKKLYIHSHHCTLNRKKPLIPRKDPLDTSESYKSHFIIHTCTFTLSHDTDLILLLIQQKWLCCM